MQIRAATAKDDPRINRLLRTLHPDTRGELTTTSVRQGHAAFVAERDGDVVGFALATFVAYGVCSYGAVEELVVAEASRGRGVGQELLNACLARLRHEKVEVIFASALDDAAAAFYTRNGFRACTGRWLYHSPE